MAGPRDVGDVMAVRMGGALANLPVILGLCLLAIPTLITLGEQVWVTEAGAHGPIVLAVGAWLLVRELAGAKDLVAPGKPALAFAVFGVSLLVYIFGRAFDFISLEATGLYGAATAVLYQRIGGRALVSLWFPIAYLAFLIPPPGWLIDQATAPLKLFVSWISMNTLALFGLPIAHEGVTIYVGSYRLLVEDACSGMNSIVGLVAVSLLYIYLLRGANPRYAALLVLATVPIAVVGNIARIIVLILLTHFFGDEVAQGFLHTMAGLFLFAIDLLLVFALDKVLWKVLPAKWKTS